MHFHRVGKFERLRCWQLFQKDIPSEKVAQVPRQVRGAPGALSSQVREVDVLERPGQPAEVDDGVVSEQFLKTDDGGHFAPRALDAAPLADVFRVCGLLSDEVGRCEVDGVAGEIAEEEVERGALEGLVGGRYRKALTEVIGTDSEED